MANQSLAIGVVVLNFENYTDSIKCIESHLNIPSVNEIVVVDNNSSNESFEKLTEYIKHLDDEIVTLIRSSSNLGYSGGFNLGLRSFRNNLDRVVIATSDTVYVGGDLAAPYGLGSLIVGVIGPGLVGVSGLPVSPPRATMSPAYIVWFLTNYWVTEFLIYCKGLGRKKRNQKKTNFSQMPTVARPVFQVHGSWMMLTSEFIKHFDGIPCETFLFAEEDHIALSSAVDGFSVVFDPHIKVEHEGETSSPSASSNFFSWRRRHEAKAKSLLRRRFSILDVLTAFNNVRSNL